MTSSWNSQKAKILGSTSIWVLDWCLILRKFGVNKSFLRPCWTTLQHYSDVIMGAMMSQITSLTIAYPTVHSGVHQRKHQSSASMAFVWGIHRSPVISPHKWSVTRKMFPFDDVIMEFANNVIQCTMFHVSCRNSLALGKFGCYIQSIIFEIVVQIVACVLAEELLSGERQRTSLMTK